VLAAAAREGLAAGAVLGITRAGGEHLHDDELDALERRLGTVALAALG
jgi:hypothetical protein